MDRKEIAKAIRAELKENGITNKQVGVTSKSALYDDVVRVNIKDLKVSYNLVNTIASKYKLISYDQANGEILAGGNMYINIQFDYESILKAKKDYLQKAEEIITQGEKYKENESMTVFEKNNLTILYQSKWCNGNPPSISLNEKPEGWEKETCYCLTNIKRHDARSIESISEALLMFSCQYGIDILKENQQEQDKIHKEDTKKNNKIDKDMLKSLSNILEITKDLEWTIKNIYIEDNSIHANIINKYGVEKIEGLYAGSDFSEEPTKQMYQLLLKEFNLKEKNNITITEKEPQQQNLKKQDITENKQENNNINVSVSFNEAKNGIELHFTHKPSQEVREQIKSNGFRWSHPQKIWFTKDTKERREFLKSIGFLNNENNSNDPITVSEVEKNIENVEYPEIDINDIESYTISKELSKRENENSMFRRNDTDHTKELQDVLRSANNNVIELCSMEGCTSYIAYKAKTMLQNFKKNYSNAYTAVLEHKANNVSWMISGRGGLNTRRYNKKQEQLTNKMKHQSELIDKFNYKIEQFENQIRNNQKQKLKIELENNLNSIEEVPKFKRVKIKYNGDATAYNNIFNLNNTNCIMEGTGHQLNGYTIIKNWGCFRVYNAQGAEVWNTKTNENLDVAKKYVLYLINQEQKQKAI